jgi:ribonuclease D
MNATELQLIKFKGQIHLIRNDQDLQRCESKMSSVKAWGFDTETRPSFKKGEFYHVALLQLATDDDAYLIRLHHITRFDFLKKIFEDAEILKVGVAIRDDIKQLQKRFPFTAQNFIELQDLAKQKSMNNFGLKGMTEEVLNARLSKQAKITNWEAPTLTEAQVMYAATDAWVGLELFRHIQQRPGSALPPPQKT